MHTEGGGKVQGSVDPRFPAGGPFLVPEILAFKAFPGNISPEFEESFWDFPSFSSGAPAKSSLINEEAVQNPH